MLGRIDLNGLSLRDPVYAWLVVAPLILFCACMWQVAKRRQALGRLKRRQLPVRERIAALGAWPFWLCLLSGVTCITLAMALPQITTARVRTAGLDLVVLQDGSASMHVRDVAPDRWQRSMKFVRQLAESLRWQQDRMALALFARIAAPQVRLTSDPNTIFFFLDHLVRESPFPLKDETTWDTNIEAGIYWGTRLIDKDEEFNGPSPNVRAFVLISDGQVWSGEIERAIALAQARDIPIFTVGVGTAAGGYIPEAPVDAPNPSSGSRVAVMSTLHAALDRSSMMAIAVAGRGRHFDLDRLPDRQIATSIIDNARQRAGPRGVEPTVEDVYWPFLFAGGCLTCLGVLFLRERGELWLESAGAVLAMWIVWSIVS